MKELLVILSMLHGADGATTVVALRQGAREVNPLLPQNPVANVAVKSGTATGAVYAIHTLSHTHPKLARTIAWAAIGLQVAVVSNNVRTVRQGRR